MKTFFKIIFSISIFLLCFWIGAAILGHFIPLEFADKNAQYIFYKIRFFGIPVIVFVALLRFINPKEPANAIIGKSILIIFAAGFAFLIMVVSLFGGMCEWTTDRIYFENKKNPSIKIVRRNYGCGAYDSGLPQYKICKARNITGYLVWMPEIDTNTIDKNFWKRIDVNTK